MSELEGNDFKWCCLEESGFWLLVEAIKLLLVAIFTRLRGTLLSRFVNDRLYYTKNSSFGPVMLISSSNYGALQFYSLTIANRVYFIRSMRMCPRIRDIQHSKSNINFLESRISRVCQHHEYKIFKFNTLALMAPLFRSLKSAFPRRCRICGIDITSPSNYFALEGSIYKTFSDPLTSLLAFFTTLGQQ